MENNSLLEKYINLTSLFPTNESLRNDLDTLRSLLESRDLALENNREQITTWEWIVSAMNHGGELISRFLRYIWYPLGDSKSEVEGVVNECYDCCMLINFVAKALAELRNVVQIRDLEPQDEKFLCSSYAVLLLLHKRLDCALDDEEVSAFLQAPDAEKRNQFSVEGLCWNSGGLDKSNTFTVVKDVEILLNVSEVVACTILEFCYRLTHSELTRTVEDSSCLKSYFEALLIELGSLKCHLNNTWTEYNTWSTQYLRIENGNGEPMASRFTRENKLFRNSTEMSKIANDMVSVFSEISTIANVLKNSMDNGEPVRLSNSVNDNFPKDSQLRIQGLVQDSNVMLSKLVRLSRVNEEIVNSMLRVNNTESKTSVGSVVNVPQAEESSDSADEVDIVHGASVSVYEHGKEELHSCPRAFSSIDRSEKFEVYQLPEREESDEEIDTRNIYEWESDANETKAAHEFVMSELKQVLVGVSDVMNKRENEAFIEKYGTNFLQQVLVAETHSSGDQGETNGALNSSSAETEPSSSTLRHRVGKEHFNKENALDIGTAEQQITIGAPFGLTMHRANFAPLQDEYTLKDDGFEPDSSGEDS